MFWHMVKKEILMIWRRPRELVVLLLMPFILITILGSALGTIMDGGEESGSLHAKLLVVLKDDTVNAQKETVSEIEASTVSPEEKKMQMDTVYAVDPVSTFMHEIKENKELKKLVTMTVVEEENSTSAEESEYTGILTIPSGFTEQFYQKLLYGKEISAEWSFKETDSTSLAATVLKDILVSYQKELSYMNISAELNSEYTPTNSSAVGKLENVTKKKVVDSFSYYAIGMCVMFVFFVASTVAGFAYQQKESYMYQRILLANVSPYTFFFGIFVSTFSLSFIQLHLLFGLSALVYDVVFASFIHYFVVTFLLNILAASFAVFTAALSFRANSNNVPTLFTNMLIPILAFAGGSYFDLSASGGFMETLGEFSPLGAAITAYLKVYQGYSLMDIAGQMEAILLFSGILLLVSVVLLMRKRGALA
ncbi:MULTISPECIES: ABC transporter permease [Bacillaceae]|uniref:ABC transporter permease n=1 Tax=Bacillaceae TaxID=186817 RepID=UPI001E3E8FD5|nr:MULTISPECIES: ABC transporter permease [Bacillaceae]MCE4050416.1 ABC transporter permease [Bacillus sp. Au-Bac7]MDL0434640.1 ABC transporter permease [Niallia sp. SS-2023]UPO88398.1 ABC transporter permease [Niallia sp. Man26]